METTDGLLLVTGGSGLIGRHLCSSLKAQGCEVLSFDLRNDPAQDIRLRPALETALHHAVGIVHLAAVSRVSWAQNDPLLCRQTNIEALEVLVRLSLEARRKPWLIFASSREVYGNPARLPVHEDDLLAPVNTYGHSKRAGEIIIDQAREAGLLANICRFSNVYGCPTDHRDRVAMAFARMAAYGGTMHVEGGEHTFDFTQVLDVVDGISRLVQPTSSRHLLPPIHFASGEGVTLRELAATAAAHARRPVEIVEVPARAFDVSSFIGDTTRAAALLGWRRRVSIGEGLKLLIEDIAKEAAS